MLYASLSSNVPIFLSCCQSFHAPPPSFLLTVCRARVLNSLSKPLTSGSIVCPLIITCCLVSTHNGERCLPPSTFIFPQLFGRWILQKFILFSPFSWSDVISQLQKTGFHFCLSVSVWVSVIHRLLPEVANRSSLLCGLLASFLELFSIIISRSQIFSFLFQ